MMPFKFSNVLFIKAVFDWLYCSLEHVQVMLCRLLAERRMPWRYRTLFCHIVPSPPLPPFLTIFEPRRGENPALKLRRILLPISLRMTNFSLLPTIFGAWEISSRDNGSTSRD